MLRGKKETIQQIDLLRGEGVPACSVLSVYETEVGIMGGEEERTKNFLNALQVYPIETPIARLAAQYGRLYAKKGKTLNPIDALIAATCIVHHLVLVTYDLTSFPMPELQLYPMREARA